MKKLLFLLFVASCAYREVGDRQVDKSVFQRRYFKPSESMQAGIPKGNILDLTFDEYVDSHVRNVSSGNSYQLSGASYFAQTYVEFEEVGGASWYGDEFHGKHTANGEIYDANAMTAAHRTLPLPSMIRVTNLRNGRVVIVRVNDRGPFSGNRIIDVSKKAAEELGFKDQGTTKVYIQLLRDDTDEMIKKMKIKN